MAGGRGDKREHGAKRGARGKRGSNRRTAGGRGGSGEEASNGDNSVNFTSPPPPAEQVDNYAVLNLDTPETSHSSWRATLLRYRLWCFTTTNERFKFGHKQRQSCVMPEKGHFLVYVHRHGKWMCIVIDGPTGYLTGYITRSSTTHKKIQENGSKKTAEGISKIKFPVYIEGAERLPWKGSYMYAANCLLGDMGLQKSFTVMYNHLEGIEIFEDHVVQKEGENFILHLPEAGRSNELYYKIDNNFLVGCKLGSMLLSDARRWSVRTGKTYGIMVSVSPDKRALKRQGKSGEIDPESDKEKEFGPEVEEELKIIEDIRVYYREVKDPRLFRLKDLPVQLGSQGPLDNKLKKLLEPGAQDLVHSMFLIEPFKKFKRANTYQETEESTHNENMDSTGSQIVSVQPDFLNKSHDEHKGSAQVMSQKDQAEQSHSWAGLRNLGNTCFANSVLQFLHCIPELRSAILRFSKAMGTKLVEQASYDLMDSIREVFFLLDNNPTVVSPIKFLKNLEEQYAMYKQRDGDLHRQQDAADCLSDLMDTLTETLRTEHREQGNLIKSLFGVDLLYSVSGEDGEEAKTESVNYLNCLLPGNVNGLFEGLELALGAHNSSINRLPRYLTINLERVKFDADTKQSVKVFSKLNYPLDFDAYGLCSDDMKKELEANRKGTLIYVEDSVNRAIDKADLSIPKEQLTGLYDLIALITHEGPDINSGHYIALVKQEEDRWIQFDDETKTILKNEEVLKLTGGGDVQMAYICLYKARVGPEGSFNNELENFVWKVPNFC